MRYIAGEFKNATNALYLGRGYNFPIALEGALKLKEISYIHAEAYAAATNYQGSYLLYRDLLQSRFRAYDNTMVVRIKKGDYITSLARQYNTTVAAILSANGLTNQDRLDPNTELIIPVLP